MEIMDVTLTQIALLLLACLIATYIRIKDEPVTPIKELGWMGIAEIFIGSLIAGFLAMWLLISQGVEIVSYASFIIVTGTAYSGLGAARAALNIVTKTKATAP